MFALHRVLLCKFSAVLYLHVFFCLQKYSHVKLAGTKEHRAFYRTKTWWSGFIFTCLGELANFVSYAFAPLAIVAPLNAVSVLSKYLLLSFRYMYWILQIHIPTLINMLFIKIQQIKMRAWIKSSDCSLWNCFPASSILGFIFLRERLKPKDFASKICNWNYTSKEFVLYRVNKIRFSLGDISEQYGLVFLGYILVIGGAYLLVSFGPNSHEKLIAANIVKHLVGWPVLLYLVRYLS